jgi:hypothetical protein
MLLIIDEVVDKVRGALNLRLIAIKRKNFSSFIRLFFLNSSENFVHFIFLNEFYE